LEQQLQGIGVSPGIAIAPVFKFSRQRYHVPKYFITDVEAEIERLDKAIQLTREDLTTIYEQTVAGLGEAHAEIFRAHLMILSDVALRDDIIEHLNSDFTNVEYLLDQLAKRYVQVMESLDDERFRERTTDLLDVVDRLQRRLLDSERPGLHQLEGISIIVAKDLSPSDTATLDTEHAIGLLVEAGSVTSHSAILARALEIPAILGIPNAFDAIPAESLLILDGAAGLVIVNPEQATIDKYASIQKKQALHKEKLFRISEAREACTEDGVPISLCANIELPFEIEHSLRAKAQGIGLYRTEYLFINRNTLPSEEEQYESYSHAVKLLAPHPVTLRTIDIGGDKFVAHLQLLKEDNPQLGWRAVRFCLARPDIFKTQLRAMLRASVHGTMRIMFPMISGVEELKQVKRIVAEVREALDTENIAYDKNISIGSMVEVPSAAVVADLIAEECDFFSLGTNDLIQYLLAVDRVNEKIAHLYEPAHPAVLRMIHAVCSAAKAAGIECSICGEMAGDPLYTELLIGLGIKTLSMAPFAIPPIRAEISQISSVKAHALAEQVLQTRTASEIKALITERHQKRTESFEKLFLHDNNDLSKRST
jgi:phosphotransferase system enzyme I (PtsI)